jgi:alcohol dehydrogenase, propanol-preferring
VPGIAPVLMKAGAVREPGPVDVHPLVEVTRTVPRPGSGRLRPVVEACVFWRTDLYLAEREVSLKRDLVVPGREVASRAGSLGKGANRNVEEDRSGVACSGKARGSGDDCLGRENLCLAPTATRWDVDGGVGLIPPPPLRRARK